MVGLRGGRVAVRLLAGAMALGVAVGGGALPARAAVPAVANTWSGLMFRSLNPSGETVRLQDELDAQQAAADARAREMAAAARADAAAQGRLAPALAADQRARERLTLARAALREARAGLVAARKLKPADQRAVDRATKAVAAGVKVRDKALARSQRTAAEVKPLQVKAGKTAAKLRRATAAFQAADSVAAQTRQMLAGEAYDPVLAAQAAALSREVVNQVRGGFTTGDTTQVYGVTVHRSLAYAFQRMLDDARRDGVVLSGGGFRTRQRQIELRTINGCPDVWTAPSSSCRVPTAIPGRSLHEIGLAIDITSGGRTINDRRSPAFVWLAANAGSYGLVNLPSEPWHWSITGG